MRPTPGGDPATDMSRSRKSSIVDSTAPYAPGPTAFFLAREEDVDKMRNGATKDGGEGSSSASSVAKSKDSVYGVQSLESALGDAFGAKSTDSSLSSRHEKGEQAEGGAQDEDETPSIVSSPGRKIHGVSGLGHRHQHSSTVSQPLTPLQTASPAPDWSSNMPSTPKSGSLGSLRLSDGDSQVGIEDSGDEEDLRSGTVELVMPSLAMPARRPFTERGKRMGRLKVCVAGRQGVGKTSLIRAIVRQCEDIVHVDPLTTSASFSPSTRPGKSKGKADRTKGTGTSLITEISASTKSFPSWWADMEESRTMRRRRSSADTVLERNLCFVDTPGIQTSSSLDSDLEFLVQYIEESFWRNDALAEMTDAERLNLMSGNGGTLIDAVLFIFSGEDNMVTDIEYFHRLTALTNVIPVIGKADKLDRDTIHLLRASILDKLQSASVKPFLFGNSVEGAIEANSTNIQIHDQPSSASEEPPAIDTANPESFSTQPPIPSQNFSPPFAISSLLGSDSLEMDASLLMSPSYSPPLLPSDLLSLVSQLFDPDMISWLRYCAGRKFLAWREQQLSAALVELNDSTQMVVSDPLRRARLQRLTGEVGSRASVPSDMLVHQPMLGPSSATAGAEQGFSFTSRWADNLHHNATVFDNLPHPDRARWLLEQIHEEVARGSIGVVGDRPSVGRTCTANTLIPITPGAPRSGAISKRSSRSSRRPRNIAEAQLPAWAQRSGEKLRKAKNVDPHDPLGLCGAWDGWGKVLVWGVGGGVVVGAVWAVVKGWVVTWGWREA